MHRNCLRNSVGKYSFGKIDIKIGESMELKQDFIERITNCNWFENCGDQNFDKFEVIFLKR